MYDDCHTAYESDCVRVILRDLPHSINGFTIFDGFDFYTIVLNSRLTFEHQRETYFHELSHIACGDFARRLDINSDMLCSDASTIETVRRKTAL